MNLALEELQVVEPLYPCQGQYPVGVCDPDRLIDYSGYVNDEAEGFIERLPVMVVVGVIVTIFCFVLLAERAS